MDADTWEDCLERATSRYPDLLATGLGLRLRDAPQRFEAAMVPLRSAPVTLIHRDAHLDNVLFRADGSLVLLDWDGVSVAPGAADLARVLAEGTALASAHQCLSMLLTAYLEEVRKTGGSDVQLPDLTACVNAAMVPRLQGAIAWAGAPGNDSQLATRVLAMRRQMLERMCDWYDG
jgi:thiamine kinase-like enzyme